MEEEGREASVEAHVSSAQVKGIGSDCTECLLACKSNQQKANGHRSLNVTLTLDKVVSFQLWL